MRITMVGHSTLVLSGGGTTFITDPYFGTLGHVAYARLKPPAFKREDLREVDAVLVSHSHWDHTDPRYLRGLDASTPVFGPAGTSLILKLKGVRNFVPMKPWESREIGAAVVTAVPAVHISRTIGFVVELDGVCAYFAGDTYHRPFMSEVGRRFRIDVAMMPVATFLIPPTMGDRGATAAARDLRPKIVIPIHLGITPRSFLLRTSQGPESFTKRLRAAGIETQVVVLREGEQWESQSEARAATA